MSMNDGALRDGDRERAHGPWRLLSLPRIYTWFQNGLAVPGVRAQIAATYIRARPGDAVLDIGCGPADILQFLPGTRYVGVDLNRRHLSEARRRYPHAQFLEMDVRALPVEWRGRFDLVLAQGVLHHFSDEQLVPMLAGAYALMKNRARLVTIDPVFAPGQRFVARMMASVDRGRHVRTVEQYQEIARRVFPQVTAAVRHDLMRIPYTHLLMECVAQRE
jgi:SAM-dependent methyltransferase